MSEMIMIATMLAILISGLIAGPAWVNVVIANDAPSDVNVTIPIGAGRS